MMLGGAMAASAFDIDVDREGVLWLSGELDMHATDAFAEAAERATHRAEGDVIVDLSRLEFLDSSGIRAILAIGMSDRRVVLRRPAPRVKKVLDLTGIIGRHGITLADD